MWQSVV